MNTVNLDLIDEIDINKFIDLVIQKINNDSEESLSSLFNLTPEEYSDFSVESMEFSVRSFNCLTRANKKTVADILVIPFNSFLKIRNLGRTSASEIIDKVLHFIFINYPQIKANTPPKAPESAGRLSEKGKEELRRFLDGEIIDESRIIENNIGE